MTKTAPAAASALAGAIAPAAGAGEGATALSPRVVEEWRQRLADGAVPWSSSDAVDLIASLEELKSTVCAVQAQATVVLDEAQRCEQAAAGMPARRRGLGVAAQVGLARRESPHRGAVLLGAAKVWCTEMPHTFAALRDGRLSEHRAMLLVSETACLELEDRREVDALVCADPSALDGLGNRQLHALVRRHAARLDPAAVVRRARKAASERCVTLRPAPDTMGYVTALLPVAQAVAVYAALCRAADGAVIDPEGRAVDSDAFGAPRSRGQIMADTLVERVTGQSTADAVPVTVDLVVSDATLLGAGHEPSEVLGFGPVPAQVARELVAAGIDAGAAWLRRLYADPGGDLVAMTSRSRFFPAGLADFLRIRDQGICRTPYCGAPIRHIDHIVPASAGGPTSARNGEGLCVACNLAKEAPGWRRRPLDGVPLHEKGNEEEGSGTATRHAARVLTPTGHGHLSRAGAMPMPAMPAPAMPAPAMPAPAMPAPAELVLESDVLGATSEPAAGDLLDRRKPSVVDICFSELVAEYVGYAA